MTISLFFLLFLVGFFVIGGLSALRSRNTTDDYYLASQDVAPWLAGLSAVATNNSGYMFIGMIGLTYVTGWSSIWLMIGWITGDLMASWLVLRSLRTAADSEHVHSYPQLLARWHGHRYRKLQVVAAMMTMVFLSVYGAAQLKAGGKALHAILGWDVNTGAIIGAILVVGYSIAGGIRASIWTDAAQSFVMMGAMILMMSVSIHSVGGISETWTALHHVENGFMQWFDEKSMLDAGLMIGGWLFAGFAVLGQPHIMIRFMTFDHIRHIRHIRAWYYTWFVLFYSATMVTGLVTRLLLPDVQGFDPELALPRLAHQLLAEPLVGLVLAGLFAATISTADSLVLVCSSALTVDLASSRPGLAKAKLGTLISVAISFVIAVSGSTTVFRLVLDAWGVLGSAFAPLVLLYARGLHLREGVALATVGLGALTFIAWPMVMTESSVYAVLPAILAGLATGIIGTKLFPDSAV